VFIPFCPVILAIAAAVSGGSMTLIDDSPAADTTGGGWTATRSNIDVYPDFANRTVRVHGRLTLRLDSGNSLGPTLRLGHDLAPFFRTQSNFMRFASVTASGATARLNRAGDKRGIVLADIRFPHAKTRGSEIDVTYDVIMVKPSFEFVITDGVAMGADGMGWYARPILATGTWSATIDPTPGITRVHMPDGWHSVATGAFMSRTKERGGWVESWQQNITRARSFAVGPYRTSTRRIGKMDVRMYGLTPAMNPDTLANNVATIIRTLSDRYGPYPYSKYAAAEFPDSAVRWWGDALADFQILRTSLLESTNGGFSSLAHEIGHAWWGNTVTPAWPGGYMINEAMANYSTMLALEGVYGPERYRHSLKVDESGGPPDYTIANHFRMIAEGKDIALSQLNQGGIEYQIAQVKGPHIYHMLRRTVGDEVFFSTLRKLVRNYAGKPLSLDQMRTAFIEAAPDKGLMQFFEQWLDRTGAPVFKAALTCDTNGTQKVNHLRLTQTQPGAAYVFPLVVELRGDGSSLRRTLPITATETAAEISAAECYSSVELDPDRDLFIWHPEYQR
jgi:hypothetical protein